MHTDHRPTPGQRPAANHEPPDLQEIREARRRLGQRVRTTPVWEWMGREIEERTAPHTAVVAKLELFQYTGTFKPRGALLNSLALSRQELAHGLTAVSAGNHAIAVAFAAATLGTTAKVVMIASANPARVAAAKAYGAEVELIADVHEAFEEVERLRREEGRAFIHPFEGRQTALGTATVGLELMEQAPALDAVIVPIGGGGLIAGIANAVKEMAPSCQVYGVEPEGADTMHRSFAAGEPRSIEQVATIADSLGAPFALPYSFSLCRRFVDELVLVSDDDLRDAMRVLFDGLKLAVEPAGAAATAALLGPLRERLAGQRVGLVVCGSNIDSHTFHRHLESPADRA
jgi:threonine dehydratase